MTLKIELTKKGKPCIIFNKYKYRECYTVQSGETTWRCLGQTCKAKIRTNSNRTNVLESTNNHSGPHPVTLRSLASPKQLSLKTSTPTTSSRISTPATAAKPSTLQALTPAAIPVGSSPAGPINMILSATLDEENNNLKERIAELEKRLEVVLDHSIESDTRLLQYTSEVFVANSSLVENGSRVRCAVRIVGERGRVVLGR